MFSRIEELKEQPTRLRNADEDECPAHCRLGQCHDCAVWSAPSLDETATCRMFSALAEEGEGRYLLHTSIFNEKMKQQLHVDGPDRWVWVV